MRLTKHMREAFVRAVMVDVPQIDYDEQMQNIALTGAVDLMPPAVRDAYKKHPEFFSLEWQSVRGCGSFYLPVPDSHKLKPDVVEAIQKLKLSKDSQANCRNDLRLKLEGCAAACTTLTSLKDMLPEFVKYMPADEPAACKTLPVVQNVVSDFDLIGWVNLCK